MLKNKSIDFVSKSNIYLAFSSIMIVLILILSIYPGVLVDIQFKGGTIIEYQYEGVSISTEDIKAIASDTIGDEINVRYKKSINNVDSFEIELVEQKGVDATTQSIFTDAIEEKYGDNVELLSIASVAPNIGKEFFIKSMVAIIFAAAILIIYIGLRFKMISGWSAGVMAVAALIHDVIIVYGVFVIFRMPLDYNFVAVVLTILGYSINDTIIVYDRIRENKKIMPKAGIAEIVNKSINDTLSRTINTTISTMLTMLVVTIVAMVYNVPSILSFSLPLMIGMLSGVYSTICIASSLWVKWQEKPKGKVQN